MRRTRATNGMISYGPLEARRGGDIAALCSFAQRRATVILTRVVSQETPAFYNNSSGIVGLQNEKLAIDVDAAAGQT